MSTRIEASGAQRRRTAMMASGLLAALSLPLLATPADAVKRCRWISASGIGTSRNLASRAGRLWSASGTMNSSMSITA